MIKSKHNIHKRSAFILIICMTFFIVSCQATPEQTYVVSKLQDDSAALTKVEDSSDTERDIDRKESKLVDTIENGSNTIIIDARINHDDNAKIAKRMVTAKKFTDGEDLEQLASSLFPDGKLYNGAGKRSKEEITDEIVLIKKKISDAKNHDEVVTEDGISIKYNEEVLQNMLKSLEKEYEETLDYEPSPASFSFAHNEDAPGVEFATYHCVLSDDNSKDIIIQNSVEGSILAADSSNTVVDDAKEYMTAKEVAESDDFSKAQEIAGKLVKRLAIDELELNAACRGEVTSNTGESLPEQAYVFYYTPTFDGLPLSYIANYLGTTAMFVDGSDQYNLLISPEYLRVCVFQDQVDSVFWNNPLEVVDTRENIDTQLSWPEIKDLFYRQIDRVFNDTGRYHDSKIYIHRIEFGLTKILAQDNNEYYYLVPTWSFFGYAVDKNANDPDSLSTIETCFVTINAVDGSIIDRGLMY